MIEEIKNKIKEDPLCELSIDELIKISDLDYNEYVDLFGKELVAQSQMKSQ